ncbi:MAG: glycosyltransferase [bacterium]|nr:glycosyltransferase [bacterium]
MNEPHAFPDAATSSSLRLLVVNFEMDECSPVLAWQAGVVNALAQRCAQVLVLTERIGEYRAPANVSVQRLNVRPAGIPYRVGGCLIVLWQCFSLMRAHRVNACFIHMNHPWAYRLYPAFRRLRVPVLLWYAHGTVTPSLRLALKCVSRVITSTPEGFRIASPKVRIIGQGIDTERFRLPAGTQVRQGLITVGRLSRRKRLDLLLEAMAQLKALLPSHRVHLRIIGAPLTADDNEYVHELHAKKISLGLQNLVEFVGAVPQTELPNIYGSAQLMLNVSETGSLDKVILEALACGCPILTSNPAARETLAAYPEFFTATDDPKALAHSLATLLQRASAYQPAALRALVSGRHDLNTYAQQIFHHLEEI